MEISLLIIISLFIIGILFGIVASAVGIGGGLMYVPFLIFIMGESGSDASYISTFAIVFTSSSGFLKFKSQGRVDIKTGLIYLIFAIPGTYLGAVLAENELNEELMKGLFAVFVGISAIRGILKAYLVKNDNTDVDTKIEFSTSEEDGLIHKIKYRKLVDEDGKIFEYEVRLGIGVLFAFIGGLLAGLLGIGGGIIFVPLLTIISAVPIHIAIATSTAMIMIITLISVIIRTNERINNGTFDLSFLLNHGLPLGLGSVIGAYIGAKKVKKIDSKNLLTGFWLIALIASFRMIFDVIF
ncbi:MAG: sulfite exporter TauE/SafE family protein [Candidatus Heimdallarchaeota archaeon]|nr:sulfite exporter TauE/SafE family protein [Candidatus Heimdallarchaeota archaeon]